uniref:Uncharacterized protein n=1 Tax=Ananas comosus var. bracteatus TaxID=296719 RepID=A0A6V7NWY2_ANACO|nr:unnamed protein product [Ananas comosus var. bracteatus]
MEKGGAPAAASTSPKDVDGLVKRLEEMEARTKRLEDAVEEHRKKLRESHDSLRTMKDAVVAEQELRKRTVDGLLELEERLDREKLARAYLQRLFRKSRS